MTAAPASIADYALIGDGRSAGLVSRSGSLDWLCWPDFGSPPLFDALLSGGPGGVFHVRPQVPFTTTRRYVGDSSVLETVFECAVGRVRITDWMPAAPQSERRQELWPQRHLLRRVEGIEGEVPIEARFDPRSGPERREPRLESHGPLGWSCEVHGGRLTLDSDGAFAPSAQGSGIESSFRLCRGEHHDFSLAFDSEQPGVVPVLGPEVDRLRMLTLREAQEWAARCRYDGPFRDAVVRSALTLRLISVAPGGTCFAPRPIGGARPGRVPFGDGGRPRHAARTARALFELGYEREAMELVEGLLHTRRPAWPDCAGIVEAWTEAVRHGHRPDRSTARALAGLGETLCRRWREPDHGIWEIPKERLHYTQSKVLAWTALDRLVAWGRQGLVPSRGDRAGREREAIRAVVERRAWSSGLQSYVRSFDSGDPDASLLLLALHGYADPRSPRMRSTRRHVHEQLGADGLLRRFPAGLQGADRAEGAFAVCGFWDVECRAREGDVEGAHRQLGSLVATANDVGLMGEQIDRETGALRGRFPEVRTHAGLIGAALTLARIVASPGEDSELSWAEQA
jgi:hypothetical protein